MPAPSSQTSTREDHIPGTTITHCFITVHDHDAALAFYRDLVGLEVGVDIPLDGGRWLTVRAPGQEDAVQISLETPTGRAGDESALRKVMADGSLTAAIIGVDDCDAMFERLKKAGAPVIQQPVDQFYGTRDCAFQDPSGNMVRFAQPLADQTPGN